MFLDNVLLKCSNTLLTPTAKLALIYLRCRGITIEDIKKYNIGYIGKIFQKVESLEPEAKIFNEWLGPLGCRVKDRIVFPIYDELGNIKGIETRALDQKAILDVVPQNIISKFEIDFLKLPKTSVRYNKFYLEKNKWTPCFFGLPWVMQSIWETKTVFLTEGIFDCLSVLKVFPNCVSSLTANLNEFQEDWLRRYAKNVFLLFDMDSKGRAAISKIKTDIGKEFSIHSLTFKGKDLNQLLVTAGLKEFKLQLETKTKLFL